MERRRRRRGSPRRFHLLCARLDRWRRRQVRGSYGAMVRRGSHSGLSHLHRAARGGVHVVPPAVPNDGTARLVTPQILGRSPALARMWRPLWLHHGLGRTDRLSAYALDDRHLLRSPSSQTGILKMFRVVLLIIALAAGGG